MKASDIKVGGRYRARVGSRLTAVEVLEIFKVEKRPGYRRGGTSYRVRNLITGRETTFKTAAKFRGPAIAGVNYAADKPWPSKADLASWFLWYRLRGLDAGKLSPNRIRAIQHEYDRLDDPHRWLQDNCVEFAANYRNIDTASWTPVPFRDRVLPVVVQLVRLEAVYRGLEVSWDESRIVVNYRGSTFDATPSDGVVNVDRNGVNVGQFQMRESSPVPAAHEYLDAIAKIVTSV